MMIEKTVEKGKSANTDPTPRLFTVLPYPQQIVEFQICPTDHQRRLAMTTTPPLLIYPCSMQDFTLVPTRTCPRLNAKTMTRHKSR
jgi:hypothetical protein